MSARSLPVILTPDAELDLQSILHYTRRRWGETQRDRYRTVLQRAFDTIAANPEIGKRQDSGPSDRRAFQVRQHVVYYRLDSDRVTVLRILHGRMDAAIHLTDEDDEAP